MTSHCWGWIGACSTGTSHLQAGVGCDDSAACLEVQTPVGSALVAVASDGAGSAALSHCGSRIVTQTFCRSVSAFLKNGGRAAMLHEQTAYDWLDEIRDRISLAARKSAAKPRDFAATLIGCVVEDNIASVIHVGDGACAIRRAQTTEWHVPSWPAQGEYASTTYFVTDDPQPRVSLSSVDGEIEEIAVFTDGIERLALDFSASTAFRPFFESIFPALRREGVGRHRRLSCYLRTFLDSSRMAERTDDDKTLIMARRMQR